MREHVGADFGRLPIAPRGFVEETAQGGGAGFGNPPRARLLAAGIFARHEAEKRQEL